MPSLSLLALLGFFVSFSLPSISPACSPAQLASLNAVVSQRLATGYFPSHDAIHVVLRHPDPEARQLAVSSITDRFKRGWPTVWPNTHLQAAEAIGMLDNDLTPEVVTGILDSIRKDHLPILVAYSKGRWGEFLADLRSIIGAVDKLLEKPAHSQVVSSALSLRKEALDTWLKGVVKSEPPNPLDRFVEIRRRTNYFPSHDAIHVVLRHPDPEARQLAVSSITDRFKRGWPTVWPNTHLQAAEAIGMLDNDLTPEVVTGILDSIRKDHLPILVAYSKGRWKEPIADVRSIIEAVDQFLRQWPVADSVVQSARDLRKDASAVLQSLEADAQRNSDKR